MIGGMVGAVPDEVDNGWLVGVYKEKEMKGEVQVEKYIKYIKWLHMKYNCGM